MDTKLSPLPVTLVLGFAGSGKTTLINYLCGRFEAPVRVMQSGSQTIGDGCICCTGVKDLKLAIDQLLDERESGTVECDRLFIEAEQETDPVPVLRTIRNHFSSESICVSEVITVVSAANFTSTDVPRWLVTNQIFFADRVVVNHCDLATADQIDRCYWQIRAVKWLPIINATRGIVDPDEIWRMSVGLSDAEIEALIQQRQEARQSRNFAQADRIRNQLQAVGVTLIDQPQAQIRWHR